VSVPPWDQFGVELIDLMKVVPSRVVIWATSVGNPGGV